MALRLSASSAQLQIANIYVVDNRARLALEVASPFTTLAERIYAQMVAAGIFLEPDPKNQFFTDVAAIVDNTSLTLSKIAADEVAATDLVSLAYATQADDLIALVDTIVINIKPQVTDTVSVADVLDLSYIYGAPPVLGAVYLNQTLFG